MGPGPINADPRVLRAMSAPLLGQFDPVFREYMKQASELYRGVFQTRNRWTLLVDGTARAAIEAALVSLIEPGDRVLVPVFGRFGHLKVEIAKRCGAEVRALETEWGTVFPHEVLERRSAVSAQAGGGLPRRYLDHHGAATCTSGKSLPGNNALLYVDATATLGGMDLPTDAWQLDVVSAGLQKCLGGPPGSAPLTLNERAEKIVRAGTIRKQGLRDRASQTGDGPMHPLELLRPRHDHGLLVGQGAQPPYRGHHHALRGARVRAHPARGRPADGVRAPCARFAGAGGRAIGNGAQALRRPGAQDAQRHRGLYPAGVDGEAVRRALLEQHNIEIGTSFGPLHGRIWRIGTMGYNARAEAVERRCAPWKRFFPEKLKLPRGAASMPPYRFTAEVAGRAARAALGAATAKCARSSAAAFMCARMASTPASATPGSAAAR